MKIKNLLKVICLIYIFILLPNITLAARPSKYADLTPAHKAFLKEIADKKGYIAYQDVGSANSELNTKFNEMKNAAASKGHTLTIVSGYRSYDDQVGTFFNSASSVTSPISEANIFKEDGSNKTSAETAYLARAVASATPGYSEHSTGLAIDINSVSSSFASTAEYTWLKANAATYGFALSYPEGSTAGAGFEPWHWKYIGGSKKVDDYKGISDSTGGNIGTTPPGITPETGVGTGDPAKATPVSYKSFTSFPGIGQISSLCELTKALWFIGYAILFISVIGMYMYGGFLYTSSGVNASGINQAKGIFTNSTIGLVLGLSVYIIINTLNPGLLNTQCTITPVPNAPTGSGASNSDPVGAGGTGSISAEQDCSGTCPGDCTSLRSLGVTVAEWNGINGPKRTDFLKTPVANSVKNMENMMKSELNISRPFQVTAAYTGCVGHSSGSMHYRGIAVDLESQNGVPNGTIISYCKKVGFTFTLNESNHVHCDFR